MGSLLLGERLLEAGFLGAQCLQLLSETGVNRSSTRRSLLRASLDLLELLRERLHLGFKLSVHGLQALYLSSVSVEATLRPGIVLLAELLQLIVGFFQFMVELFKLCKL